MFGTQETTNPKYWKEGKENKKREREPRIFVATERPLKLSQNPDLILMSQLNACNPSKREERDLFSLRQLDLLCGQGFSSPTGEL